MPAPNITDSTLCKMFDPIPRFQEDDAYSHRQHLAGKTHINSN